MKNLKKLFASVASLAILASMFPAVTLGAASYSDELQEAYDYAYNVGSTTMSSIDAANMYGSLTRNHMAKMMVNRAKEVKGLEADTDKTCEFNDLAGQSQEMKDYIEEACQMGLMGVGITAFNPNGVVTRAQFGTVLSRVLRGDENEGGDPYYANHLEALQDADIMNNISNPMANEIRGYVMLMMMRADDAGSETPAICETPENQTACSLGLDSCPAECQDDEDDEPAYEIAGNLGIDLDNSTPDSLKLPKGAQGVEVAVFEVTADEDVDLFSATLERVGMGASTAVEDVALFTEDGRVSKAKSFNSDDEAVVTFSPALTIKKGETVLLKAVVSTKAGASVGDEFAVALTAMDTTAEDVDADYPITANTMEIGSVTATPVVIAMDGSVSALKVGETDAEVLKFKISNNTVTKENVELSSITFKENGSIDEEDELSNFTLRYDGEEVATTENATDKYVTFNLDDAVLIEEGKTEKFVVTADIDGGAAKTVQLYIDKALDVMAIADKYGFVSITNNVTTSLSTAVNVEAGELSIVTTEPEMTEIRKDKDNIVIGEIKFVANAGKTLELDDFALKLEVDAVPTANTQELLAIFENIELYNASAGGVYDLACTETSAGAASIALTDKLTCGDTDMDIALKDGGTTTFEIRLDTTNTSISPAALKFHVDVDVAGAVKVRETTDDNLVTDVTPSALSYKSITVQDSSAVVTALTLASAKSAVIGSEGVVLHKFEIEAGDSSDIEVDEIKLAGTVVDNSTAGSAGFNNTRVNSVKLYKNEVTAANLLDTVGGSQIASNVATFDGFKVTVKKGEKVTFYATVDVINDVNQALDTITASVTSVSAEDTDNDDVTVTGTPAASTTTLTIRGVGTLAVIADNTDTSTNKAKNVLGGTTSDFVASYEFTATNEGVLVKDLTLTQTNAAVDLQAAVSEVIIYANDKTTELARESVSSDTVTFDNINFVVEEGNENVYVKVVASKIGKDQAGVQTADLDLALTVTDADGAESDKTVSLPGVTADSNAFSVLPVKISNIAFVNSYGGVTVASNLTNGENVIGIIAVTTDSSTNTNTTNGSSLKTELESMEVSVSTDIAAAGVTAFTVEKINGTVGAKTIAQLDGTAFVLGTTAPSVGINLFKGVALGADEEVENGTTVYYVVKATVSGLAAASNKYIQLKLNDLDTAATATVEYSSNNSDDTETYDGTDNVASLRIGVTSLSSASISSNY